MTRRPLTRPSKFRPLWVVVVVSLFIVGSFTFMWLLGKFVLVPVCGWLTDTFGWWLVAPALLVLWLVGRREKRRAS